MMTKIKRNKRLSPSKARAAVRDKVLSLRRRLGAGGKLASREATARALDVSPGSVYNWERAGTVPHRHAARKLDALLAAKPETAKPETRTAVVKVDKRRYQLTEPKAASTTAEKLAIMADAIARCGGVKAAKVALERVELALA